MRFKLMERPAMTNFPFFPGSKLKQFNFHREKFGLFRDYCVNLPIVRLLSFILSIYILVLSAVPCCLHDSCNDDQAIENTNHPDDHNKKEGCGACSPFFCHSCSAGCIVPEIVNYSVATIPYVPATYNSIFTSRVCSHYSGFCRQPPAPRP